MASETKPNELFDQRNCMCVGDYCWVKSIEGKLHSTGWDNSEVWKRGFIREMTNDTVTVYYHVDSIYTVKELKKLDTEQLKYNRHLRNTVGQGSNTAIKDKDTLLTAERRLEYMRNIHAQSIYPRSFGGPHSIRNKSEEESKNIEELKEDSDDCDLDK